MKRLFGSAFDRGISFGILFAAGLLLAGAPSAHAAVYYWVGGGADTNWTTGANWEGGVAPGAGDALVFHSTTAVTNNNDYAEGTRFDGITQALGSASFVLNGNAIGLGGNVTNLSTNTLTVALSSLAMLQNSTLAAASGSLTFSGALSGDGFGLIKTGPQTVTLTRANTYTGVTQIGAGTLTANFNASGAPTSAIINSNSALILGGPSQENRRLMLTGKNNQASVQSFNGTTFKAGRSVISSARTGSGSMTANLGALTRENAAAVQFILPAAGAITVDSATPLSNGILGGWATVGTDWATHSAGTIAVYTDYTAANGGTSPQITSNASTNVRLNSAQNQFELLNGSTTSGTNTVTIASTTNLAAGQSFSGAGIPAGARIVSVDGDTQITLSVNALATATGLTLYAGNPVTMESAGMTDINTLKFDDNRNWILDIGTGNTLRLAAAGAIWRASASGSNTVAVVNGTLTAGGTPNAAGELLLNTGGASNTSTSRATPAMRIDSQIVDNGSGAVTLVKSGPQTVTLNNQNTYSGGTHIHQGRLIANTAGALGSGDVHVYSDIVGDYDHGQVVVSGGTYNNHFYLAGPGPTLKVSTVDYTLGTLVVGANTDISGDVTLLTDTRISPMVGAQTAVISGHITGDAALTFFSSGATDGTLTLSNPKNDWTGNASLNMTGRSAKTNILRAGADEVLPHGDHAGALIFNNSSSSTGAYVVFELNGYDETINGLYSQGSNTGAGNRVIRNSTTSGRPASTLTIGANDASGSYFGTITNGNATSVLNLRKIGSGTQTLSGTMSYSGTTVVESGILDMQGTLTGTSGVTITGGTFAYGNATALNRGVTIDGGTFRYTSTGNYAGALTFTAGRLAGTNWNGNLGGLTIGTGQIVAPGASPGVATTTNQTWAGGGAYEFEIDDATGTEGTNWDRLDVTDTLNISGLTAGDPFTVKVVSLTLAGGEPGDISNFEPALGYSWKFVTFGTLEGDFSGDLFAVDASGFTNDIGSGTFSVTQQGDALYLTYIPEPGSLGLLALGALVLAARRRRRRG